MALATLHAEPGLIPSTHTMGWNTITAGDQMPSSSLCGHYTHMVHKHRSRPTHTNIK